jgi:hypothetical protein
MPHRSNERGSLILKRKFRGVSLIRRATGTSDPRVVEQIDLMLAALYNQGRLDVVEAIAAGRLHPLQALSRWRQGRELALPPADVLPSLTGALEAWAERLPAGEHRRKVLGSIRALRIPDRATIEDTPRLFDAYRRRSHDRPRSVNLARAHLRAFLRDTVGTSHHLYLTLKDTRPLATGEREKGTPHDLRTLRAVREKLGDLGGMLWTMAVTGMGNKEYWHDGFDVLEDRVAVHGKKRGGRERVVPRWSEPVVQPIAGEKTFRSALTEASGGTVLIYDLRRSFARWCEEAGVIATNREAYLGHGPRTMTALYTRGQLPGQLAQDAAKLRAYLAAHG